MSWHKPGATDGLLNLSCSPHPRSCSNVCPELWPELTQSLARVLLSPAWRAAVHGVTESDTTERANSNISCTAPVPTHLGPYLSGAVTCYFNASVPGDPPPHPSPTDHSFEFLIVMILRLLYSWLHSCVCVCLSYPTFHDPMDCGLPDSSVHRIFPARILEQVSISYSRRSSQSGIEPTSPVSPALAGGFFTTVPMSRGSQTGAVPQSQP